MDSKRRALLGTGAAAAAIAATGGAFGASKAKPVGSFYQRGNVRIHYQVRSFLKAHRASA
jgi:hypothetical protein